jgi:hypothetical protein
LAEPASEVSSSQIRASGDPAIALFAIDQGRRPLRPARPTSLPCRVKPRLVGVRNLTRPSLLGKAEGGHEVTSPIKCGECNKEISPLAMQCPRCGTQQFPNVNLALVPEEQQALQNRYDEARKAARSVGLEELAEQFEAYVGGSFAVMCVKFDELERLASNDSELKATFYNLADTRVPRAQPPAGTDWNRIREVVDTAVYGDEVKEHIRFAALSTSAKGLTAYGPCTLVCATTHIKKRASAFEKNSCQFFLDLRKIDIDRTIEIPKGYRSTWPDRPKLALAKLGKRLLGDMTPDQFSSVLLTAGSTTADDDFIEVHIFGAMSVETFQQVTIDETAAANHYAPPALNDLRKKLFNFGLLKD